MVANSASSSQALTISTSIWHVALTLVDLSADLLHLSECVVRTIFLVQTGKSDPDLEQYSAPISSISSGAPNLDK
ncbi:unnamed protein product [Calypogeia fissa]